MIVKAKKLISASKSAFLISAIISGIAALIVISNSSFARGQELYVSLGILALAAFAGVFTAISAWPSVAVGQNQDQDISGRDGRNLRRILVAIGAGLFASIGLVAGIIPLFSPQGAVESAPGKLEGTLDQLACQSETREVWTEEERRLPMFSTLERSSGHSWQSLADGAAGDFCVGFDGGEFRLLSASAEVDTSSCPIGSAAARCDVDGNAICKVQVRSFVNENC